MVKNCKYCGKVFNASGKQIYCDECKRAVNFDVLKGKIHDPRIAQICKRCGATFYGNKRKFCSNECTKQAQVERAKKQRQDRKKTKYAKLCKHCGVSFETYNSFKLYCSKTCSGKSERAKKVYTKTKTCRYCGKEFIFKQHREAQFCCVSCSVKYRNKQRERIQKEKPLRFCFICGNQLETNQLKYCSEGYRKRRESIRAFNCAKKRHEKEVKLRTCGECGKEFTPRYGEKKRKFCSEVCATRNARRTARAVRRARKRNTQCEPVNPIDILRRDKWTCQICGVATPRKLRGTTNDNAPEVDHIIPLARGGKHIESNLQCTCRKCNQRKGDSISA